MIGRIVTIREDKFFCFVRATGLEQDAFLHASELLLPDDVEFQKDALKGRDVDFELEHGGRGPIAKNARLVADW